MVLPPPAEPSSHVTRRVLRVRDAVWTPDDDVLAAEEPLEIRLLWHETDESPAERKSIAITMRTPGDDFELAVGFLRGEGVIASREDFVDVSYCLDEDVVARQQTFNVVTVTLRPGLRIDLARLERNFYTTSSCGICGKAALDALEIQGCAPLPLGASVGADVLRALPGALRASQALFGQTGGLHAAGLFDAAGRLRCLREDVGRHNALDKVIGERLIAGEDVLDECVLLLSGRASFELLQKALTARIPIVAAVGAPSSLAAQLAETFNITLLGFTRADGFNIYAGAERVLR
jgi:FdhD protein